MQLSKKQRFIISFIMAFISVIGVTISLDVYDIKYDTVFFSSVNGITRLLMDIYNSMSDERLNFGLILLVVTFLIYKAWGMKSRKSKISSACMAGIFSFFHVLGISYSDTNSWDLIFSSAKALFKAGLKYMGYFIILYCIFLMLFEMLDRYILNIENKEHRFIFSWKMALKMSLVFFAAYLPYLIIFFPGVSNMVTTVQIMAYFNYSVKNVAFTPALGLEYIMTAHHPPFVTFIFGTFAKIGLLFSENITFGVMLYSICHMLLLSVVFTTVTLYLKYIGVGNKVTKWIRVIYMFCPLFGMWSITMSKDSLFSIMCLVLTILLVEIVRTNGTVLSSFRFDLGLFFIILLTMLTKKQGVYIIFIIGAVFLVVYGKKYWKQVMTVFITSLFLYQVVYTNMILPALNIVPGGMQEILSLPFQQTARFVKEHGDEVTEEEKAAINQLLDYDRLEVLYKPELSDPVKFTYNQHASRADLVNYFKVWFRQFLNHPDTYVQATVNNIYGYFYLDTNQQPLFFKFHNLTEKYYKKLLDTGVLDEVALLNIPEKAELDQFKVNSSSLFSPLRQGIKYMFKFVLKVPGLGLLFTVGFYTWVIIICLIVYIYQKKTNYMIAFLPMILSILVLVLSPQNQNWRYILPLVFTLPFMIGFVFFKEEKVNKEIGRGGLLEETSITGD